MRKMNRAILWTTIAAVALVLTVGTRTLLGVRAQRGAGAPSGATVKIDNFSFGPETITVSAGTTVTWTNDDDVPHVVASDDKTFQSKALDTGDRFSHTFTKPGVYNYFCEVHPRMTAKVIVR